MQAKEAVDRGIQLTDERGEAEAEARTGGSRFRKGLMLEILVSIPIWIAIIWILLSLE